MIENQGKLLDGVRRALDEAFSENMGGSEVLAAICKACREFDSKLYLCATGTAGGAADDREWLYDVTCLDYDAEYFLRQTVLVAECQWGPEEEIYGDFEKLLVAQAAVRVMVFDGTYPAGYEKVFKAFDEYISRCRHSHDAWSRRRACDGPRCGGPGRPDLCCSSSASPGPRAATPFTAA